MQFSSRTASHPHAASLLGLAALTFLGLLGARSAQAQTYTFTALDDPSAGTYTNNFGTLSGTIASGINDAGQVVGYYADSNGFDHGFLATPAAVPEASTTVSFGLLLALGLGGGVIAARKKKAAAVA